MLTFSDAWFLTSLIRINNWCSLEQVISTGDVINHAIFTMEEINRALSSLIGLNLVEVDDKRMMRATSKAHTLCDDNFSKADSFTKIEILLNSLRKTEESKKYEITDFFLESDVRNAYDNYVRNISKKNTLAS